MATRREPFDLPLGQTLSGEQRSFPSRQSIENLLTGDTEQQVEMQNRLAQNTILSEIRQTDIEARRSNNLAEMQNRLAREAEEHRQRIVRAAENRLEQLRQRREEQGTPPRPAPTPAPSPRPAPTPAPSSPSAPVAAPQLLRQEAKLRNMVENLQSQLSDISSELTNLREQLAGKEKTPDANYTAGPFLEGERLLDLGE